MKNKNSKEDFYHVEATTDDSLSGMATTEMTGLIPNNPKNKEEWNSYKSIYPFSPEQYVESEGK